MLKKLFVLFCTGIFTTQIQAQNESFTMRVVNTSYQLNSAWEILYGPDDSLWVTENSAYKVSRININNGGKTMLIDLSGKKNFTNPPKWPQGGLMGMVLHPSMYSEWPNASKPWVYLAYVYRYNSTTGCANNNGPCNFKTKIVRYDYNRSTHTLSNETLITQDLNGSNDHNSGRLAIGKIDNVFYLFYTIGDMGAGQFNNLARPNRAQTRDSLEGKILRFNLEPDGDANVNDKWIPNDNPYTNASTKKTPVWSWGHRNAQGIVMGSNGILYSSEQQDKSDDEINIIIDGSNYGWPKVSGYCDGNYNGLKLANQTISNEVQNCNTLNAKEPAYTFYTHNNPASLSSNYLSWSTIACSSIDVYEKNVIPYWNRSLLVPSLKAGLIYRLKLDATGTVVTDTSTIAIMRNKGRYRDICISPDGYKIYVACDISGQTSGPTGSYNGGGTAPLNAGRILEFTYTGSVLALPEAKATPDKVSSIRIYPNPASKTLFVTTLAGTPKPLSFEFFDVSGRRVLTGNSKADRFTVDVSSLRSGVYLLKIYSAYRIPVTSEKILVQ